MKLSHIPLRLSTGGFILNSGLVKADLDQESAAGLQAMAANVFPQVKQIEPEQFGKYISYAEIALGGALLAPFIPSRLAGLALAAFSGSMIGMYLKMPGMTEEGSVRPTQQGTALAKDVWMLGIALALILDTKNKKNTLAA